MRWKFWEDEHKRTIDLISEYLDECLGADEKRRVAQHLEGCESCRLELSTLTMARGLLRGLPAAEPRRSFAIAPPVEAPRTPSYFRGMALATAASFFLLVIVSAGEWGLSYPTAGVRMAQESKGMASMAEDSRRSAPDMESRASAPAAAGQGASSEAAPAPVAPQPPAVRDAAPTTPAQDNFQLEEDATHSSGPMTLISLSRIVLAVFTTLLLLFTMYAGWKARWRI